MDNKLENTLLTIFYGMNYPGAGLSVPEKKKGQKRKVSFGAIERIINKIKI